MGKRSRQKRLRRELRPLVRAAVAKARDDAARDLRRVKIIPPGTEGASQPIKPDEQRRPRLVMPSALATQIVGASRG